MQPRITKRERRLHLSYELPHRIHCAQIYPVQAPNGSTVIIYGHDNGLRVLWRGGKRRKTQVTAANPPAPATNGIPAGAEVISLDDDNDNEPAPVTGSKTAEQPEYEDEEEELDSDSPYAPIIEDLEISVGTDVLHVAVPALSPAVLSLAPDILHSTALISISSADGALRIIQVPLEPPVAEEKDAVIAKISHNQVELSAGGPMASDVAMKLVSFPQQSKPSAENRAQQGDGAVLVAAAAQSLKVWQIQIAGGELVEPEKHQFKSQYLPASVGKIAFHPSPRSGQLLVADVTGSVRIYDPFAVPASRRRPASSDSILDFSAHKSTSGSWVMAYHTSFQDIRDPPDAAPVLARRKKVLDARWIMTGRAILVLLEDGEWGIWETSGVSQPSRRVEDFLFRGFLGPSSSSTDSAENTKFKKGAPKLAPMTPNTRKAKSESLFAGIPKPVGVASTGGISIAATSARVGQSDESAALWYDGEIYSIPSMQAFWQRSTANNASNKSGGGGFGSLYSPGLTHITELNLINEHITSVSQFVPRNPVAGASALGSVNATRDLLISADRRLVVLQSLRPATPLRVLFQQAVVAERPASRGDQVMLDAGELDIGGVDRILDSMAAADGRTRKVGFAH